MEVRHNVPTTRDELCRFVVQVQVSEERNGKIVPPPNDQSPPKIVNCKKYKCKDKKLNRKEKIRCRKQKKKCRKEQKRNKGGKKDKVQKHEPIDALELQVCVR